MGNGNRNRETMNEELDETLSFCWSSTGLDSSNLEGQLSEIDSTFKVGRLLDDRFRLKGKIGAGRMGQVFRARDERLNRDVAVKVIAFAFDLDDADRRLEHEARLGASLQHSNIASVLDFGCAGKFRFTVFEYVNGETLRSILRRRGRLPLPEVQPIIGQVARALDYAHVKGIVHRDLKPENICATVTGQFKVLDLGLARYLSMERASSSYSGTPAYSSPEQASCQPVDGRSDQYSLAVICYELLLGRRLFASKDAATMLLHQIRSPVPDPREFLTDLDDAIADAIVRALLKNPDERFATCQEFAAAIGDQLTASSNPVVRDFRKRSAQLLHLLLAARLHIGEQTGSCLRRSRI